MEFHPDLPAYLTDAMAALRDHGYQCFLVGGAVRDLLLGETPKDYDLATNASVFQIEAVFQSDKKINGNGRKHGTVTVRIAKNNIEISTFRHEGEEPSTIESDLNHRDLTVNAIAYDGERLVDPLGGLVDLQQGVLRMALDADSTIKEDPLRILRALRFHAKYGFAIEANTSVAMKKLYPLLENVANERIATELRTILLAPDIKDVLLEYQDIFAFLFPPLKPTIGFDQHNHWHAHELYVHIAHVVGGTKPEFLTRLAALLHDNGKVDTVSIENRDGEIIYHFPYHPIVSEQLAEPWLREYRFTNIEVPIVLFLIKFHDSKIATTTKSVRRFLAHCSSVQGIEPIKLLEMLLDIQQSDHADHTKLVPIPSDEILSIARNIIEGKEAFSIKDLAINGNDVMALGFTGKGIGVALRYALEQVLSENVPNEKDALLALLKKTF